MKKIWIVCLSAVLPLLAWGQESYTIPVNELTTDLGGRFSVTADKKLAKGLHLSVDGEVRLSDNFTSVGRWQAGASLTYKVNPYLKLGGGYLFIDKLKSSGTWSPRHRFYFDARVGLRAGDWNFSLKERLQLTHRNADDLNTFQTNPNALALKSRIKAEYKGFRSVSPYAYVEARTVLNDPACTAKWNGTAFSDYSFIGYTDAYFNRLRTALGLEWKLSKQHALDFSLLGDYCYDKNIDTNAEGTKLKSLSYDRAFNTSICIGYKFSF
ncbi:MAG: DUF2490 domain-containing protein [Bacteroidales bacterium]|nr:DUF2490 domain-containing protein [Bacteroidales bacterium]